MYRCKECKKPLTEFDVMFQFNMFRNEEYTKCNCFGCAAKQPLLGRIMRHKRRRTNVKQLAIRVILTLMLFGVHWLFKDHIDMLNGYVYMISWLIWIGWTWDFLKNGNVGYMLGRDMTSEVVGKEWVLTENSYDGSVTGKQVDKTVYHNDPGPIGCLLGLAIGAFALIFAPVWGCVFWLLQLLACCIPPNCPREFTRAFYQTCKQIPNLNDKYYGFETMMVQNRKKYDSAMKRYRKKVEAVEAKYSIMGSEEVQRRIQKIKFTDVKISIQGKKHIFAGWKGSSWDRKKPPIYNFLLEERKGDTRGKILVDGYFVYLDNEYWREDWKSFGVDP